VPIEEASEFGVVQIDENWRIIGFQEKPENPTPLPNDTTKA
jgi:glucose-1-phosphate adenylyltransferase